ncbi:MAG: hypothetical protein HQ546_09090 [Planctomycetes bacterium]|nr:hypothetical protein [Planctomycetota bacterium]
MKRQYIVGILFFSALWGLSEAVLGGWIYSAHMRHAGAVILTVIGFAILTLARIHVPLPGASTAIGALAMLFKFLNEPFFACHLLAIFLLGVAYDLVFSLAGGRNKALIGLGATYLGFAMFALIITYVVRYSYWIDVGWPKVVHYVAFVGTITALCNAACVPLADYLGRSLSKGTVTKTYLRVWGFRATSFVTAGLWVVAIMRQLWGHA